jgi:hypothetical protein
MSSMRNKAEDGQTKAGTKKQRRPFYQFTEIRSALLLETV